MEKCFQLIGHPEWFKGKKLIKGRQANMVFNPSKSNSKVMATPLDSYSYVNSKESNTFARMDKIHASHMFRGLQNDEGSKQLGACCSCCTFHLVCRYIY